MWTFLRVVIFEWILARIGVRWLLTLAGVGALALLLVVGLPMLIVIVAGGFFLWRLLRKPEPAPPA